MTENELKIFSEEIRLESIRSMASCGSGHVGGILSMAELFAVLYGEILNMEPSNPEKKDRDRVILSKGHCGPVLYSALALKGYFPVEDLLTLNRNGSNFPSHCNRFHTPGVDACTGSLGQGGSIGAGIALGLKANGLNSNVYVVFGDGECDEGQVWETALFAAHQKIDNLICFIDRNHQQLDGWTKDVCEVGDLARKFRDFGWNSVTVDGHDVEAIKQAVIDAQGISGKPSMIVLETIKGKGWSVTEGKSGIHHIAVNGDQLAVAEREIGGRIDSLRREG